MTVAPIPIRGGVQFDRRDRARTIRVAAHPETPLVTLSVWRDDRCVATHQMSPDDVARLIGMLGDALAACTTT